MEAHQQPESSSRSEYDDSSSSDSDNWPSCGNIPLIDYEEEMAKVEKLSIKGTDEPLIIDDACYHWKYGNFIGDVETPVYFPAKILFTEMNYRAPYVGGGGGFMTDIDFDEKTKSLLKKYKEKFQAQFPGVKLVTYADHGRKEQILVAFPKTFVFRTEIMSIRLNVQITGLQRKSEKKMRLKFKAVDIFYEVDGLGVNISTRNA
jgi:hypothetical protein